MSERSNLVLRRGRGGSGRGSTGLLSNVLGANGVRLRLLTLPLAASRPHEVVVNAVDATVLVEGVEGLGHPEVADALLVTEGARRGLSLVERVVERGAADLLVHVVALVEGLRDADEHEDLLVKHALGASVSDGRGKGALGHDDAFRFGVTVSARPDWPNSSTLPVLFKRLSECFILSLRQPGFRIMAIALQATVERMLVLDSLTDHKDYRDSKEDKGWIHMGLPFDPNPCPPLNISQRLDSRQQCP